MDMVFHGGAGRLKYEFVLRPGAKVEDIRLAYRGAGALSVDKGGNLVIPTSLGVLRDSTPQSYQVIEGRRVPVASRFVLDRNRAGAYGFAVGDYDAGQPLVIDPGLLYSTYLGGTGGDLGRGIAVDAAGSAYVTGETLANDFPTTPGAFDTSQNASTDAFVTKLNATGTALVYSTILGGSNGDQGHGIAVDAAGSAYVTGLTLAGGFPTTPGAFDTTMNSQQDAFVTKLNATGSALLYSTYLGGNDFDQGLGIAVDAAGSAYVTGNSHSTNLPTTPGAFDSTQNGDSDAFLTKLNATGSALVYSTFLGGSGVDVGRGIAVDAAGSAYVTGLTFSANFPTTSGAFDTTHNGGDDAFVTKLNAVGSAPLLYSTYVGGSSSDTGRGIAVDAAGSAYVTGFTTSGDFPTTAGAFDTSQNGSFDAFVTKLNAAGSALYSTYLGGSGGFVVGFGIAVDAAGSAYVTGSTNSTNLPTTPGAFDTTSNGDQDAFVTKLNAAGSALLYSTYLGGSGLDQGLGIAIDASGSAYVTGLTQSTNFPTTAGAFDRIFATGQSVDQDAFVAKLELVGAPATLTLSPAAATNPVGTTHTVTATVTDAAGQLVRGVVVRFTVTGSVSTSGQCTTNANGQCSFAYTGPTAPGVDAITAFADSDNDSVQDPGEPTGAAEKTWVAAAPATVTLSPATATNPVGTSHTVTATVADAFGNPTAGIVVRFSVSGSVNTSGQCTTNGNGQCSFSYAGPTAPGVDAITAFADSDNDAVQDVGEPAGAAEKTWVPAAPATLTLSPATATNPVGTSHTVTAAVADAFGNPTPGIVVRFTVSGSVNTSGQCTTNGNGQCSFSYTGPSAPGVDAITAYADSDNDAVQDVGEPAGAAEKTWVAAAPATVTLSPAAATNPVGTSHTVTATVADAFGNPTPGIVVRFTVTGAHNVSGSCTTGPNGQCSFSYTGTQAGADTITAFADSDNDAFQDAGEPAGAVTKVWTPPTTGCPPNGGDDDEDDDGLEDRDEHVLGTLLGNPDSDRDGRRDGNDDQDEDGRDDEDEDDGSDDECPNDSDGDGTDDEDEDDSDDD